MKAIPDKDMKNIDCASGDFIVNEKTVEDTTFPDITATYSKDWQNGKSDGRHQEHI